MNKQTWINIGLLGFIIILASYLLLSEKPAEEEPLMLGLEEGSEDKVLEAFAGKLDDIDGTGLRKLAQPLTVYVTYLTAWANKDGSINFRPDHLSRDGDVAKLLGLE